MTRFFARVVVALAVLAAFPAMAQPVDTGHLIAELVARDATVTPGATTYVAVRQKIDKGWHTYWRNSGDSGEATKVVWTLPVGWTAGDIVWPAPQRQPTGPLMNYGYHDEVLLPVPITVPASARPGETVTLKAAAAFLVCEEICVPEDAVLSLTLPVADGLAKPDPKWGAAIARSLAEAPAPAGLDAAFAKQGANLTLAITGAALKDADLSDAYFFPFGSTVIDHAKPQAIERGPDGLTLTLTPGYAFQEGAGPQAMAGVLSLGGKAYEIAAKAGALPAGASGLGAPAKASGDGAALGLPLAAAFAFLGGLILNLMPCVFPILAMKAASLAGHAHDRRAAQAQGIAFLAGVLTTFLVLAGVLIAVRAGGAAVGWGFQLQSPPVVAGLALLMLAVALNLSGVFEVGTSLQGAGSGLASRQGLAGAFFTGALAVVVAAPCTAPFMAPALGWALTQSAPAALTIFLALGLGFAAPFALAAFMPGLLSRLPKPGPWMEGFKKLMAFPMYGTAAWLAWVLAVQAGDTALARIFAAAVVLALAVWLLGVAQRRSAQGGKPLVLAGVGAMLAITATLAAVWPNYAAAPTATADAASGASASVPYEAYNPEKLAAARATGKPVFVNFTAAWCVTCQVNEKIAFSTQGVADAFKETGAVYLKADWTRKDAEIAAELAKHGRAGVPLYLVYGAKGGDGVILPQILTEGLVVRALKDAQDR
ncbi:MAG: protein-disulfide reductase DsbD family protein [Phenylobacterium sp.]|uniref:protein-disulfide reductase DsbD family protein n=1 Tax=Phenylobacterium sp. TaxID=1871053 RepID=UPI002734C0AA|nr:protein-disulfide reductase DsbD domain-containing protein [Phenylobacterium sp.]MDP3747633.1 protein-disulfide reductase DsbD family protein [Phenylobacterium sp.]